MNNKQRNEIYTCKRFTVKAHATTYTVVPQALFKFSVIMNLFTSSVTLCFDVM